MDLVRMLAERFPTHSSFGKWVISIQFQDTLWTDSSLNQFEIIE
jgi:hypothetical protein